jgi:phosphate transport system substrate-binding protein
MRGENLNRYLLVGWCLTPVLALASLACQPERKETPTKGHAIVITSESVSPLIDSEKAKFEELYPDAKVTLEIAHAREAIARLFNDTIKVIISSRALNAQEREVARKANLEIAEYKIAIDAIAIIVNPANPVDRLRTTQLDSILTGAITSWKEVGGASSARIELCFPSRNSGTFETIGEKLLRGSEPAKPEAVTATSGEMVDFIAGHPNAIGMLGLNWVSTNKEKVKVLELADPNAPDSTGTKGKYFQPHQAYVFQGFYPLTREIYFYSRADMYSVGIGFVSFVTSAPGQKIVLNSGLVPATMPVRLVQLTSEGQRQ